MTDIANVIGWKHNHQAGMCTEEGVITDFPGGIPSQADQDTWTTEYEAYVAVMLTAINARLSMIHLTNLN